MWGVYNQLGEVVAYCASPESASDLIQALELGQTQRMDIPRDQVKIQRHTGHGEL